jgi:hypothetical protein
LRRFKIRRRASIMKKRKKNGQFEKDVPSSYRSGDVDDDCEKSSQ